MPQCLTSTPSSERGTRGPAPSSRKGTSLHKTACPLHRHLARKRTAVGGPQRARRERPRWSASGATPRSARGSSTVVRTGGRQASAVRRCAGYRNTEAVYLPPCEPTKIICVHLNYRSRAIEFGRDLEGETPTYFSKPVSALNVHRGDLVRPVGCHWLNYEGEIAAIVGRPMKNVSGEEVWEHIAGFTPANDIGAHDFRGTDAGSMLRVKGMDGFCPIGPGIVSGVDLRNSGLRTYLNGRIVQEGPVSEMIWGNRLSPRGSEPPHYAAAGRHRTDRHAMALAADGGRRRRRGRDRRTRPPFQHRGGRSGPQGRPWAISPTTARGSGR